MPEENGSGEKALAPGQGMSQSVIDRPPITQLPTQPIDSQLLLLWGQIAEEVQPWGTTPKLRDQQLRKFLMTESVFSGALGIVAARNSAFSWQIEGSPRTSGKMQEVLEYSDGGEGWQSLMTKVTIDLSTQDHGAFIEIVRQSDSPEAPVLSLNCLDAGRCYHTGNPEARRAFLSA